eukprot:3679537-Amphidinium_carterae.1
MGAYGCGWTGKQTCIALSSAEAELIALINYRTEQRAGINGVIPQGKHLGIRAFDCQQVFEEGNKGGPKAKERRYNGHGLRKVRCSRTKLRGYALAGVVIASLTTRAEVVHEVAPTLVKSTGGGMLLTRSSVGEIIQDHPVENSYDMNHLMWVSGLSIMLLTMCLGFFRGCYFRKKWKEKEVATSQAVIERDHVREKELGVQQVTITTIPESTPFQPCELRSQLF